MKTAGAVCVMAGAYLFRAACMGERRRVRETMEDLCRVLRRLAEEIRLNRPPLPVLLSSLSEGCGPDTAAFLEGVSAGLRRGEDLERVWRTGAAALPLGDADRALTAELGADLRGDEERLRRAVLSAADRIGAHGAELDAARRDADRQLTALTFSAAALLVILLY